VTEDEARQLYETYTVPAAALPLFQGGGRATLITFLASGRAGNITGANYLIDGGLIKTT
jgi:hypothetical protein